MRRHENGDLTFRGAFERIERFLLRRTTLLARVSIIAIVVLLVLYHHHLLPLPSWEKAFEFLLILMLVVVERLVVL